MTQEQATNPPATRMEIFSRTHDAWEIMYADCVKATQSIEFEQYIVHDDETGKRFMQLFADKAKQGITIRLLLDRIGSREFYGSKIVEDIRKAGGVVTFYNPVNWLNLFAPKTWFPRNHTKTMLIDSEIVHIGSVCLATYMADWRDLHARITGPLVGEIARDFSHVWSRARWQAGITRSDPDSDDPDFDYLTAKARLTPSPIYRALLTQIQSSQHHVYMATPYFLPPKGLRRALRTAARRGVDVRVVLTEQSDVPLAVHVSRTYFRQLLKDGIKIFSYQGTVFHAKYSIIDGVWATLGSTNLDYLSLLLNREANIIIARRDIIDTLEGHFSDDLKNCVEIRPEFWYKIPLHHKIIGYLGRSIKRML